MCSVLFVVTSVFLSLDAQTYDYGEDLGVTAVALYDYQAGECVVSYDVLLALIL